MDVTFRSAPVVSAPTPPGPEPEVNNQQVQSGEDDREPVELRETHGVSVVLDALGIDDRIDNLPEDDKSRVSIVKDYVMEIVKSKGLSPTVGAFKKTIDGLKEDMGLDQEAEPSVILDRIAGVVKAWKNLSFIKDAKEKKNIFYKLARLSSSSEMNKEVYRLMSDYKVWE